MHGYDDSESFNETEWQRPGNPHNWVPNAQGVWPSDNEDWSFPTSGSGSKQWRGSPCI
jgi:hypothetical protein